MVARNFARAIKNLPKEMVTKHFGEKIEVEFFKGQGCKICHSTGYSGRIGIFEVLEVTKDIRKLITEKSDSDVIEQKAISEGMVTMLEDGLDKTTRGVTTIEEVLRVTKVELV